MAKSCDESASYFGSVHECIPQQVVASAHFTETLSARKVCSGDRLISSVVELERLRFCDVLDGSLTITLFDLRVGYDALDSVAEIRGKIDVAPMALCSLMTCRLSCDQGEQHGIAGGVQATGGCSGIEHGHNQWEDVWQRGDW